MKPFLTDLAKEAITQVVTSFFAELGDYLARKIIPQDGKKEKDDDEQLDD